MNPVFAIQTAPQISQIVDKAMFLSVEIFQLVNYKFHCFLYGIHYRMFLHICFGSCCTNKRFHNRRQSPLCAEKSMAVQLSREIYVSVQYINSNHTWVHRVWVFLHCSCCNSFPWVVKDVLRSPDLHDAGGPRGVRAAIGHSEAEEPLLLRPRPSASPAAAQCARAVGPDARDVPTRCPTPYPGLGFAPALRAAQRSPAP